MEMNSEFKYFCSRVNLLALLDHSGRAGNYFFQSIFDQHPEIISCPWVQYTYSYLFAGLGEGEFFDSSLAHKVMAEDSYFRLVYQPLDKVSDTLISFGSDPNTQLDREIVKEVFDSLVFNQKNISRKELVCASFYAYAKGIDRKIDAIKFILVSDVLSLRSDNFYDGFSGKAVTILLSDFPKARLISLERDPRATFASCRQQFVNQNGNMYSYHLGNYWLRFKELLRAKYTFDGCVYLFWLLYFASGARLMYAFKSIYQKQLLTVRNEDLNLNFKQTIRSISNWLDCKYLDEWNNSPYEPTNVGEIWQGKGAYNPLYSKGQTEILLGDSEEVAKKITGPNEYVTRRWRDKLLKNEKAIIEYLFKEEIIDQEYEFLVYTNKNPFFLSFLYYLFMPFNGEVPGFAR